MSELPSKKILLVFGEGRQNKEALHWSLHTAKEGGKLLRLVYVVNGDSASPVVETMLAYLEKQARMFAVPFQVEKIQGNYLSLCETKSAEEGVEVMVCIEKKKNFFKKLFERSDADGLKGRIPCELQVYQHQALLGGN